MLKTGSTFYTPETNESITLLKFETFESLEDKVLILTEEWNEMKPFNKLWEIVFVNRLFVCSFVYLFVCFASIFGVGNAFYQVCEIIIKIGVSNITNIVETIR